MTSPYEQRIMRVLTYIHDHPGHDLSLDNLADIAAMSRFHWHRVFQAMTGETCAQAVRRLRMFRAARWLECTDWPIAQIASKVGYPNSTSFARAFGDVVGCSPVSYRKNPVFAAKTTEKSKGKHIMFDLEIRDLPIQRLAALAHNGAYDGVGAKFDTLTQMASANAYWPQVRGIAGVHYDDPNTVAEKNLRCHAGLILSEGAALLEGTEEVTLQGGKHAVLRYKGPYEGIKVAYDHLFGKWLPTSGEEPADAPCYEIYLNNPADTAPAELLTEINLPLAA